MPWAQIGAAVGGLLASMLSENSSAEQSSAIQYKYQTKLNKQNYNYNTKLINLQNAFNEAMMDKANQWNLDRWNESVDLANTAHQREVKDLRAAGLNPVLSANGGAAVVNPIQSAQTSSGNSQLSSSAGMPDVDYLSAAQTASNLYQTNRQVNNDLKNSKVSRNFTRAQTDNIFNRMTIDRNNSASEIALNSAKARQISNDIKNQNALTKAQIGQIQSATKLNYSNSARAQQDTINSVYQNAEARRHSDWIKQHPKQAQYTKTLGEWTNAIGKVFHGGASVSRSAH